MTLLSNLSQAAEFFKERDCFAILTHQYPDGDTLGSAYALCGMLQQMGKKARVLLNGALPKKFLYLKTDIDEADFAEETVVSVDVADSKLLGELEKYVGRISLAIDHHSTHKPFAETYLVQADAAANCEIIFNLGLELGITFTKSISNALYTGIATDTGSFKYSNTTSNTHIIAARLMEYGCDVYSINKAMFDTVSKNKKALEAFVIGDMEYFHNDQIAFAYTTKELLNRFNITEDQVEGISAIPRTIEGVKVGITLREKDEKTFKISVRTNDGIDACAICSEFGGGGHKAAAGCAIEGTLQQVKAAMLPVVYKYLDKQE